MAAASAQNESLSTAAAAGDGVDGVEVIENNIGPGSNQVMEDGLTSSTQRCTCCPYGYHIDLDFLHFLDTLYNGDNLKSLKRIRRSKTSSVTTTPEHVAFNDHFQRNHERTREADNIVLISDGGGISTQEIVDEIDSSLPGTSYSSASITVYHQKEKQMRPLHSETVSVEIGSYVTDSTSEKKNSSCTDEDIFSSSNSSVSGTDITKLDLPSRPVVQQKIILTNATEDSSLSSRNALENVEDSRSISPVVLQAIREQLATSLQRIKDLEEQVKVIPMLEARITMLKEENGLLVVAANRTFCDVAVGDFSIVDDSVLSLTIAVPLQHTVLNEKHNDSEFLHVDKQVTRISGGTNIELLSEQSNSNLLNKSHLVTRDIGVNTDEVLEAHKDVRNVGILCKTTMQDFSGGDRTEVVDAGAGDHARNYTHDSNLWSLRTDSVTGTKTTERTQTLESRTNVSYNEALCKQLLSEINSTGVSQIERSRSVGIQCGHGNINSFKQDMITLDTLPFSSDLGIKSFMFDNSSQTDERLYSDSVSLPIKMAVTETGNEVSHDVETKIQPDTATSTDAETIAFNKNVTVFTDKTFSGQEMSSSDKVVQHESDRNSEEVVREISQKDVIICVDSTTDSVSERVLKESKVSESMVGIVSEQTLESSRCVEPVVIYDSCESSTPSSDSEDGSAMSVIEVAAGRKAMKSVDEYFDYEEQLKKLSDEQLVTFGLDTEADSDKVDSSLISTTTTIQSLNTVSPLLFDDPIQRVTTESTKFVAINGEVKDEKVTTQQQNEGAVDEAFAVPGICSPVTDHVELHTFRKDANKVSDDVTLEQKKENDHFNVDVYQPEQTPTVRDHKLVYDQSPLLNDDLAQSSDVTKKRIVITETIINRKRIDEPDADEKELLDAESSTDRLSFGYVSQEGSSDSTFAKSDVNIEDQEKGELNVSDTTKEAETTFQQQESDDLTETIAEGIPQENDPIKHQTVTELSSRETSGQEHVEISKSSTYVTVTAGTDDVHQDDTKFADSEAVVTKTDNVTVDDAETGIDSVPPKLDAMAETPNVVQNVAEAASDDVHEDGIIADIDVSGQENIATTAEDVQEDAVMAGNDGDDQYTSVKQVTFDGDIHEALAFCNQLLVCQEGTDLDKISMLDVIRKQWFMVCGRKTSSPIEIKEFLSLAQSHGDLLLHNIVNMADSDGNTALHYAVSYANTEIVKLLLETGACDVSRQNRAGYTAVMLATLLLTDLGRHSAIVRKLFESGDVNITSTLSGQTALMLAASHGKNEMAILLLESGADVNTQDEDGSTALMCASEHGHIDVIKTLLSHSSCDSTLEDIDGSTALSIAMEEGYQDIGVLLYAHMKALQGTVPEEDNDEDDQKETASS